MFSLSRYLNKTQIILIGIFILGLTLRATHWNYHLLLGDETNFHVSLRNSSPLVFTYSAEHLGLTPTFFRLAFIKILGLNIIGIRIPYIILGSLSILAIYFLTKELYSHETALVSAFILSVLPIHMVFISRYFFGYHFIFLIIQLIFFLKAVKKAIYWYPFFLLLLLIVNSRLDNLFVPFYLLLFLVVTNKYKVPLAQRDFWIGLLIFIVFLLITTHFKLIFHSGFYPWTRSVGLLNVYGSRSYLEKLTDFISAFLIPKNPNIFNIITIQHPFTFTLEGDNIVSTIIVLFIYISALRFLIKREINGLFLWILFLLPLIITPVFAYLFAERYVYLPIISGIILIASTIEWIAIMGRKFLSYKIVNSIIPLILGGLLVNNLFLINRSYRLEPKYQLKYQIKLVNFIKNHPGVFVALYPSYTPGIPPHMEPEPQIFNWLKFFFHETDYTPTDFGHGKILKLDDQRFYLEASFFDKENINELINSYKKPIYFIFPPKTGQENLILTKKEYETKTFEIFRWDPMGDKILGRLMNSSWRAYSNYNAHLAMAAIDNDVNTRWDTGKPQRPGIYYMVDLGKVYEISKIRLLQGSSVNDYPRGLALEVSIDGDNWQEIQLNNTPEELLEGIIEFAPVKARYIKLVQKGSHKIYWWSIHELYCYSTYL